MKDRIQLIREAHAKVLAEQGSSIEELLPSTLEDILDEAEHLDALDHEKEIDFDSDENEVDMTAVSVEMRKMFA
jgi:hypothetical protein|tara:strand:+ start:471 stop:692 length:222 start_codon:yes stop_codon:yes gene_type:complete